MSTNPAVTAYKVYNLSSAKLDREARRQTPDLARMVAHATIIDNIRRWSRDVASPTETVLVESDPFEDSGSDEDVEEDTDVGEVAVFAFDQEDAKEWSAQADVTEKVAIEHLDHKTCEAPKRRPPPPPPSTSIFDFKDQSWRQQNRPVMIRETAIEVDEDD